MKEFEIYGHLSNLRINFNKSEAMGIGIPQTQLAHFQHTFHFKWTDKALKYLGTYIPPKLSQIFKLNFPPLLKNVQTLLHSWKNGLHSWFGRCNILKMMVLPKFLYLLQALPIHIPANYFRQAHSLFTTFLWAGKKPRLPRKTLSLQKQHGGMAMPEIKTYYQAVHLSRLVDWCRHQETKLWPQIEQSQSDIPLNRAPWNGSTLPTRIRSHPLIGPTTSICTRLISQTSLSTKNSLLRPILGNPQFTPGIIDPTFRTLRNSGMYQASHYSNGGRWATLAELSDPNGIHRLDFLRASQLAHFLSSLTPPTVTDPPHTTFEEICMESGVLPHTLSLTYNIIITPPEDYQHPSFDKWETDLNCHLTPQKRTHILHFTHKSSICTRFQETNYKIFMRWYRTPAILQKIFPETSKLCWRCQQSTGTLIHIFWSCPRIRPFWGRVREIIQKFTDRNVPDEPAYFLHHATDTPARVYKKSIVRHLLDAAKICIPLKWKSPEPPSIATWLKKVDEISTLEDLILTSQNRGETYSKTWQLWNIFKYSAGQALQREETDI